VAEHKTAVYICEGCEIGGALDIEALSKVATGELKTPICKSHRALCDQEGLDLIKGDISSEGVTKVVIAACTPRACEPEFASLGASLVERVNLREHVVWTHEPNDEDTQMMAEDNLRMGVVKANKCEDVVPFIEEGFSKKILVVGGGVTGLTAAVEAGRAGYDVTLVEKEDTLGGMAKNLHKKVPVNAPYQELEDVGLEELIKAVEDEARVTVLKGAEIESIAGAPALFDAKIKTGGDMHEDRYGAIVLATGFEPYDVTKVEHLGASHPNVVTNVEFEAMAKEGAIKKPSDGGDVNKIAFVHCAGSRDENHLPYCSGYCCRTSLKQAAYMADANEETEVYVLYKDIRTPGQSEEFYRQVQEKGVIFTRGEVREVVGDGDMLNVTTEDVLLGEDVLLDDVDMVVLAAGMVPRTKTDFDDVAPEPVEGEEKKKDGDEVKASPRPPATALNLTYRLGPELPNLKYGFPDSHFICFPYETRRTGVYAAGSVRRPGDMEQCKLDGTGAALKAIQCVELTAEGKGMHPRVGDQSYVEVALDRCTQCKRCTEECPFGAYNEDEKGNPLANPSRCRRCGICMGACPERVISFKNYSVAMIGDMIKSVEIPDEDEEKPRVICFICENDAYPALDMAAMKRTKFSPFVRFISLRCLGSINLVWIADALAAGVDGVILLGCKHGDDYQCHFIEGSALADVRMSKISETLTRLALEPERIRVEQISITDVDKVPQIIEEFMETIEEIGMNPFKGF